MAELELYLLLTQAVSIPTTAGRKKGCLFFFFFFYAFPPEEKGENSRLSFPFSTFEAASRGQSFWCGGRGERVGMVWLAGSLVVRESSGGGENKRRDSKLFLDGIFQTGASVREQMCLLNFHCNCYWPLVQWTKLLSRTPPPPPLFTKLFSLTFQKWNLASPVPTADCGKTKQLLMAPNGALAINPLISVENPIVSGSARRKLHPAPLPPYTERSLKSTPKLMAGYGPKSLQIKGAEKIMLAGQRKLGWRRWGRMVEGAGLPLESMGRSRVAGCRISGCPWLSVLFSLPGSLRPSDISSADWLFVDAVACVISRVPLSVTPWTVALQAPLSMGFSRQEYWSGLPFLSPRDLPIPGIQQVSLALQADSLPSEPPRRQMNAKQTFKGC